MTFAEVWAAVLELAMLPSAEANCALSWSRPSRFEVGSLGSKNAVQFAAIAFWVAVLMAVLAGVLAGAELVAGAEGAVVPGELGLLLPQAARAAHTAHTRSDCRTYRRGCMGRSPDASA
jgi:hypothetical protein